MFSLSTVRTTFLNGIMKPYENIFPEPISGHIDGIPNVPVIQSDYSPDEVY
jgi:hypothetical protein